MNRAKQAYNRTYYRQHKDASAVRSLTTRIALGQTLPPGRYLAHCGAWQAITRVPHTCTACGEQFFQSEKDKP